MLTTWASTISGASETPTIDDKAATREGDGLSVVAPWRLPAFLWVELDLGRLLGQLARLVPKCIGKSTAFTLANVQYGGSNRQ